MPGRDPSPARSRRHKQRKLLRDVHERVMDVPPPERGVDPVPVLLEVLARVTTRYRAVAAEVDRLRVDRQWRTLGNGERIPHEWLRLERDLREELAHLTARMIALDIAHRSVAAREQMADAFAACLQAVADRLEFTPEQRAELPDAIRAALPPALELVVSEEDGDGLD